MRNEARIDVPASDRLPRKDILLGCGLILLTFLIYAPAFHAGFLLDDDLLLTNNPLIHDPQGCWKFWATTSTPDYLPLMSDSLWAEWRLWGMNPAGYHITNIALHAISAVLLWRLLKALSIKGSYLAGLIFLSHPVAVRSVAWIAERKNTLSLVFYLLTLLAFTRWSDSRKPSHYIAAILLFLAALLSKSSVVILPLVLLIVQYWRTQAITKKNLIEIAPFAALSVLFGIATIWYQVHGSIQPLAIKPDPLAYRIASIGDNFWFYLETLAWPVHLAMVYPKWKINTGEATAYLPTLAVFVIGTILLVVESKATKPYTLTYLYYLAALLPVIGLIPMAFYASSMVSDHLQYLAMIGPIALLAAGVATLWERLKSQGMRTALACAAAVAITVLSCMSYVQASLYKDRLTLAKNTLLTNPDSFWAHGEVGSDLMQRHQDAEAAQQFDEVLRLRPTSAPAWNNLGILAARDGDPNTAKFDYERAVQSESNYWIAWNNLGNLLYATGDKPGALSAYKKALTIRSDDAAAAAMIRRLEESPQTP